ncbi:SEC-C motif-containing protein [Seleniivibrio woodruffii]|uniref:SEC-C motif-containing protein n=2 Tax=Seleniivibrio woodruffii TaxID=1078050 RepID=A0A4R1K313_9BACT|nr:SEC-C metal-binding domain-containing protein [Seleniivibrio woodruffii]TCK58448.1 SEC-C motif-containing protein [Seleniivibrio woodruffii]TVZ36821.1 SEC-C motif-containing protein [Seleniivibrio woodruffii]
MVMKPDKYDILSFPDDGKTVVPLYEIVTLGIQTLVIPNEYNPNQVMSAYLQRLGSNRQLESLEDFQKAGHFIMSYMNAVTGMYMTLEKQELFEHMQALAHKMIEDEITLRKKKGLLALLADTLHTFEFIYQHYHPEFKNMPLKNGKKEHRRLKNYEDLCLTMLGFCNSVLMSLEEKNAKTASVEEDAKLAVLNLLMITEIANDIRISKIPAPTPKTPIRATVKTGRNDPCPCGSGLKFKKCCGKSDKILDMDDFRN